MLSRNSSLAHMSAYDVVPQMRFSKRDLTILASRMPWRETTALGQVRTARRRYVASPEEAMAMGALYLTSCLPWNCRCCLLGSPTSMSLASRSAPVPRSPLAPYPREARIRSNRRARHENGARSERGTGTERGAREERARSEERESNGHGARSERGTGTERGASEERAWSEERARNGHESGRHQLGGRGAGREAQGKRARVGGTS
jgi:hypothetical protein